LFPVTNEKYIGELAIPGIDGVFSITKETLVQIASKFLFAVKQASSIYQRIASAKGGRWFCY
jgi:hypothetical protein